MFDGSGRNPERGRRLLDSQPSEVATLYHSRVPRIESGEPLQRSVQVQDRHSEFVDGELHVIQLQLSTTVALRGVSPSGMVH